MRPFRVLLVDDEEPERDKGQELDGNGEITVVGCESLEAARKAVVEEHFHLALVDLQLDARDDKNIEGQFFLRELLDGRPSCRRVLLTRTSSKHREAIFNLLDPDGTVIEGALDKSDYERTWQDWVREQAENWRTPPLEIEGLEDVHESLSGDIEGEAAFGGDRASLTAEELEYLIISLFRANTSRGEAVPFAVDGVKLEPLTGGRSRAAVLLARLSSGESAARVACVVKVAPILDSQQESQRYERLVKFRVAPDRRAELLKSVEGDTVGGVVYAFAGESPERVRDLDSYLTEQSDTASTILYDLFGAKGDDLWREVAVDQNRTIDLGKYFFDAYKLDAEKVGAELRRYLLKRAKKLGFEVDDGDPVAHETKLSLPDEGFYGRAKIRRPYTEAFVHGDLNSTNVLISDNGRVRLIDFRYADFGPVATDFAALETSIRMQDEEGAASAEALTERVQAERRLLSTAWKDGHERPKETKLPYWACMSEQVAWHARQVSPSLVKDEYLATCLLYALRVARVSKLEEGPKLRLIAWISVLCSALDG